MAQLKASAQRLTAMLDDVLRSLKSGAALSSGNTDDLLALLDRWAKVKAELNAETDLVAKELVSRGVAYTEIDEVQGNRAGAAHARLNGPAKKAAAKTVVIDLPGKSVNDFADEIGLTPGAVRARIRRAGEAGWWGSFTSDSVTGEITRLPFGDREKGELRILDSAGYHAAKSKPGPKRKAAPEASLAED